MQATQEGLVPLKAWVKSALDQVVQIYLKQPDLEFVWVGDDAVDPLEQAQTLNILVTAGIKTREEARADLGLAPESAKGGGLGKFNPYHDPSNGQFTTAEGAGSPGGATQPAADAFGTLVASLAPLAANPSGVLSDASDGGADFQTAQGPVEPPPPPEEPPAPPAASPPEPVFPSTGTVADVVAPNGVLPGNEPVGSAGGRNMPASDDPNAAALQYVIQIYNGQVPVSVTPLGDPALGAFVAKMPDGTTITYRPAGMASERTPSTMATVQVNNPITNGLNGAASLELKFPRKRGRR
jgi:hypothetical protein